MRTQFLRAALYIAALQLTTVVHATPLVPEGVIRKASSETATLGEKTDWPIRGAVSDETGQALSGVSVTIKGAIGSTSTDQNGAFEINIPDEGATLIFSYVGFLSQEIPVNDNTSLSVVLRSDAQALDEVVVVGYGTQRRSNITGAVSSVSAKTLTELPVSSADQALQGRVAGLTVTNNGSPGTSPIVAIRGISSISFASDPLYVVDGFPTDISNIDQRDIESVDVLKDASSAAIYGSRATNGVIIITTRKGYFQDRPKISFDSYYGIQSPAKRFDLLNTEQYLQYERALNGAETPLPPRLEAGNFNQPIYEGAGQTFAQTNTDWQDAYFRTNQPLQQHNISLSGGNDISRFYTGVGVFQQEGIAQGLNFRRINYRINSEHRISKYFDFGQSFYVGQSKQRFDEPPGNRTPIVNMIRMLPYLPVFNPNNLGGYMGPQNSFDASDPVNPVETANLIENYNNTTRLLGTAYVRINFTPWLRFTSTYGIDHSNIAIQNYTPIHNDGGTSIVNIATINNDRQLFTTHLFTQQLSFDKSFEDHNLGATLVYESQGQRYRNETASGNQSTNLVKTLNGATNVAANTLYETNLIRSMLARVTYDYAGKYLLTASIRRDGLSVFAPGNKNENFPAFSAGWKVNQENFMKDAAWLSEFKLRGGYGITGINGVLLGNYPYLQPIQRNQSTYPFNGTIINGNGSFYNGLSNPDLAWEKTKQTNIGLDFGIFDNRITLVAEYFRRQTDNLILTVPTPTSYGFNGSGTLANVAAMRNNGFEFQLGYNKTNGDFTWNVMGLMSIIRNEVLGLNNENASITAGGDADFGGGGPITNTVIGQPVQSFFGFLVDGIFHNEEEIAAHATQNGAAPGDLRFRDLDGNGIINDGDRTFIGSFMPKFSYSLNFSANYKNFDLVLFLQGVQGNDIFNAARIIREGMPRLFNADVAVLNAWTPSNTNTNMPRAVNGDPNQNVRPSNRWIEDGSFLRMKNFMIGYRPSENWIKSISGNVISQFRVYISAQNLFTATNYSGLDPEIGSKNGTLTNGVDYGQYPSPRSFQLGLQATF
ncbi:TonB-dependent receptor [Olivibacter sp. SDN3]|uniref:SusC/RagA family TonB-linked outer membrane protein n=1 Tax=Olivibacter sp. SDN3 TaxID=2764720 RepID=UPI001650D937|nr:TonB-dependent receptor [Olivibacter sp. SDN3]QNL47929.1 TonB-dependent receptor [Olivibacter sp. SDN3]